MFFDNWNGLFRTFLIGVLAYACLILVLRISGKRTLTKMNAFDLVVTVALGSTLATILLSQDVALAEGVIAFITLIGLQFIITWLSLRSPQFTRLIKSEPAILFFRGKYIDSKLFSERVKKEEVQAAVRAAGSASMEQILAVVLETDGSFTVIPEKQPEDLSALKGLLKDLPESA